MKENDVIKALDFCEGYNGVSFCNDCPLFDKDNCIHILSHEASKLIRRQQAEIEGYVQDIRNKTTEAYIAGYKKGTKEFAARLKIGVPQETGVIRCADIDNLLEEMESERE